MDVTCTKCKARKPASGFAPDKRRATGVSAWCLACRAASNAAARKRKPAVVLVMPERPPVEAPAVPAQPSTPAADAGMGPYLTALEEALAAGEWTGRDAAALSLARGYARAMDGAYGDVHQLGMIGPKYLAALKAVGLTREGQSGPAVAPKGSKLDAFRVGCAAAGAS